MIFPIVFHEAARQEAREAYLFLAAEDAEMAIDFEMRLRIAFSEIQSNPEAYRVRRFGVRRKNLLRFRNHYVAYLILEGRIVIIAIGHAARRLQRGAHQCGCASGICRPFRAARYVGGCMGRGAEAPSL